MNVLVTGGTGTVGRHVVKRLRESGQRARIFSRRPRGHVDAVQGDLGTGEGVGKALAGMDVIVHAASATRELWRSGSVDVRGTRRMLELARDANIRHVVFISIVGIDGVGYPYYKTKVATERVVREGGVPWSILRATQFHEFMELLVSGFSRMPGVTALPFRWQFQPIDSREVARRIAEIALAQPAGMLPDFGGPEVRTFQSIAEAWLGARRQKRRLVDLPVPFRFSRQVADGKITCPEHKDGVITFDQYLAEKFAL